MKKHLIRKKKGDEKRDTRQTYTKRRYSVYLRIVLNDFFNLLSDTAAFASIVMLYTYALFKWRLQDSGSQNVIHRSGNSTEMEI